MRKPGKKFAAARQQVPERPHTLEDAVPLMQKVKFAKFDETVEIALRLGVDPKHADQMVRGTVVLPHGLGKSKKVLVIAGPDKQKEAEAAGADHGRRVHAGRLDHRLRGSGGRDERDGRLPHPPHESRRQQPAADDQPSRDRRLPHLVAELVHGEVLTAEQVRLNLSPVAEGLLLPSDLAFAPDGSIFIAERGGTVRVLRDGVLSDAPALDLSPAIGRDSIIPTRCSGSPTTE